MHKPITKNLITFMSFFKLSVKDISTETDIKFTSVQNLVRGKSKKIEHYKKISEVYRVPLEVFYSQHLSFNNSILIDIFMMSIREFENSLLMSIPPCKFINIILRTCFLYCSNIYDDEKILNYLLQEIRFVTTECSENA